MFIKPIWKRRIKRGIPPAASWAASNSLKKTTRNAICKDKRIMKWLPRRLSKQSKGARVWAAQLTGANETKLLVVNEQRKVAAEKQLVGGGASHNAAAAPRQRLRFIAHTMGFESRYYYCSVSADCLQQPLAPAFAQFLSNKSSKSNHLHCHEYIICHLNSTQSSE